MELPKDGGEAGPDGSGNSMAAVEQGKKSKSSRYHDSWENGVAYESLLATDIHQNTRYRVRLMNKDASRPAIAALKLVVTEHFES
jgi:hypothetical protein